MHLIRPVRQAQGAGVGEEAGQRGVLAEAHGAVDLHGAVDHVERHIGRHDLDHGNQFLGFLVAVAVHGVGRFQGHQPGLLDFTGALGDVFAAGAVLDHRLAEYHALVGALAHQLEGALGGTDQTHAVVNAAGAEATLGDFKAAALAEDDVFLGHAHVFEDHFGVAFRRVHGAEHHHRTFDVNTRGVHRHQNLRLLLVAVGVVRVGLAHHDHDFAGFAHRAADVELAAVDDVIVAVTGDGGFDVGGVGGRHFRLGHRERGADLAFHQRLEPLLLLGFVAVLGEHFHVAGVRRGAVEALGGDVVAAHLFRQRGVFQVGQARAQLAVFLGQEQVPQALGFRLGFELVQDRRRLPGVLLELLVVGVLGGHHFVIDEGAYLVDQVLGLF